MGPTLSKGFGRGRCDGARRAGLRSSTHAFWEEQEGRRHDVLTMCRELVRAQKSRGGSFVIVLRASPLRSHSALKLSPVRVRSSLVTLYLSRARPRGPAARARARGARARAVCPPTAGARARPEVPVRREAVRMTLE